MPPVDRAMAEEGVPPPTMPHTAAASGPSGWDSEQVAQWMLRSAIPGKEEVADALREEEVDGFALLRYAHKLEVKSDLGIPGGKAARVMQAIEALREEHNIAPPPSPQHGSSSMALSPVGAGGGDGAGGGGPATPRGGEGAAAQAAATPQRQQLLVARESGEVLTLMEVLQRGLTLTQCEGIAEAAEAAREELSSALKVAKRKAETLTGGLAGLDAALAALDDSAAAVGAQVAEDFEQREAAALARAGAVFDARRAELEGMLSELASERASFEAELGRTLAERGRGLRAELAAEHGRRREALEAQRAQVAARCAGARAVR